MTKILFLDIDGVLNSAHVIDEQRRADAIDRDMVERVNRIIDATDCKIVISSSWRLYHTFRNLKRCLTQHGMRDVAIDITPELDRAENNRGDEICAWLGIHPEVTQFVILDDYNDMGDIKDHLVQTTFKHGLQDEHVAKAISLLTGA